MKQLVLVFVGGGIGSILRFLLAGLLNSSDTGIPYGTLIANVLGSLIIGFILGLASKAGGLSSETTLLLATGFCGGFTTFATFAYENHVFLKNGDFLNFATYSLSSLVVGFAMVFIGMWIVRFF